MLKILRNLTIGLQVECRVVVFSFCFVLTESRLVLLVLGVLDVLGVRFFLLVLGVFI